MKNSSVTDSQAVTICLQMSSEEIDKRHACRCHSCPSPLMAISGSSTCSVILLLTLYNRLYRVGTGFHMSAHL